MIPYGKHAIGQAEIDAVVDVLANRWLTQGEMVPEFEQAMVGRLGCQYASAVSNGTAGLHLVCLALGLDQSDTLWLPANTFVATANCARYCQAQVDFVDIEMTTGNISLPGLAKKFAQAKANQCLPKVLVVVHYAGTPCDMPALAKLCSDYQCLLVEDACHAVGAEYLGENQLSSDRSEEPWLPVGRCQHSVATVFSFHPVKVMTTGEGGMVLTNDKQLHETIQSLRNHGIDKPVNARGNQWHFDQQSLGFNYRLTDIQAAIGVAQMQRLDEFLDRRRELANRYDDWFDVHGIDRLQPGPGERSSFHLYPILIPKELVDSKPELFLAFREKGIGVNVHYQPVYLHSYYRSLGFEPGLCPQAELFYQRQLSLPMFPGLTAQEQFHVQSSTLEILESFL